MTGSGARRLLLAVLLAAGCGGSVKKCKSGTLFVQVTLEGAAAQADQLIVDIALDGGAPVETKLAHTPGNGGGGLEIDFPGGYPAGHSARVDITATVAGSIMGMGGVTLDNLGQGCQSSALTVSSSSEGDLPPADLTPPPDGADLAQAKPDLFSFDLAGADLTCVPSAEDCFNGVDDDCDGLADCADPDCTGGASPQAVCVPDPGTFTLGVTAAASCPSAWPSPTPIHSNLNVGTCINGTCSCALTNSQCLIDVADYGADSTCTMAHSTSGYFLACGVFEPPASGAHFTISSGYFGVCSAGPTDAPVDTPPSWGSTQSFCGGGAVGAGCSAGNVCVPVGPNHCVIKPGTQLACPANYTLQPTHYFTGLDDSSRSCACDPCTQATDGVCNGLPILSLYSGTDHTCSSVSKVEFGSSSCFNDDLSGYSYEQANGPTLASDATCKPGSASQTGGTVATGEQTVCCTN